MVSTFKHRSKRTAYKEENGMDGAQISRIWGVSSQKIVEGEDS